MNKSNKDEVFRRAKQAHLMTAAFLSAIKSSCDPKKAFEIAAKGFAFYMINYYKRVLASTKVGTQERFDRFRQHYEESANQSSYLDIIESNSRILRVSFRRCPFAEVMEEYGLSEFSSAFCSSDYAFTKEVLPEVTFHRKHEIVKGDDYCDHAWIFKNSKGQ